MKYIPATHVGSKDLITQHESHVITLLQLHALSAWNEAIILNWVCIARCNVVVIVQVKQIRQFPKS
jgi:hypothetical protein